MDLHFSGLLSFRIKRVGKTFLREIVDITESFIHEDVANQVQQYMQEKGYKETTENLDNLDMTEEDTEIIFSFITPKAKNQQKIECKALAEEKTYAIKGITQKEVYFVDTTTRKSKQLLFAECKNNPNNYPKGMLEDIREMGWIVDSNGVAIDTNDVDYLF